MLLALVNTDYRLVLVDVGSRGYSSDVVTGQASVAFKLRQEKTKCLTAQIYLPI